MYNSNVNGQITSRAGHLQFVPNPANFGALALGSFASDLMVKPRNIVFGTTQYTVHLPANAILTHVNFRQTTSAFSSGALLNIGSDPFLSTPSAPTVTPTGGAAGSYSYLLVALDQDGLHSAASSATAITTGPTTLSGTTYNTVSFTPSATVYQYAVYRSAGGATQGKIGTIVSNFAVAAVALRDTGLVGDGSTAPNSANSGNDIVSAEALNVSAFDVVPNVNAVASPVQTAAGVPLGVNTTYITLTGTLATGAGLVLVEFYNPNSAVYSGQNIQL